MRPSSLFFLLFYSFIVSVPKSVMTFSTDLLDPRVATNRAIKGIPLQQPSMVLRLYPIDIYNIFIHSTYITHKMMFF